MSSFPVAASIESKLTEQLQPLHLQVLNESHMHNVWVLARISADPPAPSRCYDPCFHHSAFTNHSVSRPANSETHFKVVIVSEAFAAELKTPLQRHRKVNAILAEELEGPVHALSIVAKTPTQWKSMQEKKVVIDPSPSCRGGDGSLPPKHAK